MLIHTLTYTDDLTLAEFADEYGNERSTDRSTDISTGSTEDVDMHFNVKKPQVLIVQKQDPRHKNHCYRLNPSVTTNSLTSDVNMSSSPYMRGTLIHAETCKWTCEYVVNHIIDFKGPPTNRCYLVK